jgi:hypothetical protein
MTSRSQEATLGTDPGAAKEDVDIYSPISEDLPTAATASLLTSCLGIAPRQPVFSKMVADQTGELLAVAQDLGSDLKQVTFLQPSSRTTWRAQGIIEHSKLLQLAAATEDRLVSPGWIRPRGARAE